MFFVSTKKFDGVDRFHVEYNTSTIVVVVIIIAVAASGSFQVIMSNFGLVVGNTTPFILYVRDCDIEVIGV